MSDLSTSLLLLLVALTLLWLAVTDRLSRLLDAWDVVTGKTTVSATTATNTATAPMSQTAFKLPSLPVLSLNSQVSI